ncbi:MAG: HAMP domain-containing protein, partial [Candidatus Aminicenantes bacterium]
MSRNHFDNPNSSGNAGRILGGIGPRKLRTKMLLLFGTLMAGYIGLFRFLHDRPAALTVLGLAFFVLGVLCVILLSGMITRPLIQLTRAAERLAGGDLKQRARVFGRDEAGLLARTFNGMLDGLEKSFKDLEGRNRTLEDE